MIDGGIPLFGSIEVLVDGVTTVSIHDDIYYDLVVRIIPMAEVTTDDNDEKEPDEEIDVDGVDAVQVGDWQLRQPSYQIRIPNHLCPERVPTVGDLLAIMFIAQQASAVEFVD